MLSITKEFHFDSAHQLYIKNLSVEENLDIFGKCYNLHGHTYRLLVTISGARDQTGMIINFTKFKTLVTEKIINRYDHKFLNEFAEFKDIPTTVENIIVHINDILKKELLRFDLTLQAITLYETPTSFATINEHT